MPMTPAEEAEDRRRIRHNVLRKAIREQPKDLAMHALWRAIKKSANENRYPDGFVEWNQVTTEYDEFFEKLGLIEL